VDGQPSPRGSSTYIMDQSLRVSLSERLWPSTNEGVANRFFEEIEDLEVALVERCVTLCAQPEIICPYTQVW
jgi:hypothetical protein